MSWPDEAAWLRAWIVAFGSYRICRRQNRGPHVSHRGSNLKVHPAGYAGSDHPAASQVAVATGAGYVHQRPEPTKRAGYTPIYYILGIQSSRLTSRTRFVSRTYLHLSPIFHSRELGHTSKPSSEIVGYEVAYSIQQLIVDTSRRNA